jgi:Carboxylesterase family
MAQNSLYSIPSAITWRQINLPPDVGVSGIATAPDGKRVYLSGGSKLGVLDTATSEITTIATTRFLGRVVAITPDGKHAYSLGSADVLGSSSVSVLDIASNTAATTSLPNTRLLEMAITPDWKHAYATGDGRVWVIETTTNTMVDTLTGQGPAAVATMPPSDSATTVNIASCGVSVFAQGFIGDFPQQGAATGQMRQFLGIPYAAAPVGANRWNPPQRFCWEGTRQFTAFGNHCAQPPSPFGNLNFNEDCLFLNIFTPVNVDVNHPVPVMVWIHGGAFQFGESEAYNPVRLVDAGVIVVTINYRLGALGFLAHHALDKVSTRNTGNYGIQDQQEALLWVQQNISAFAGDADRVTIFGESVGGLSVLYHLASPGSERLFSRAIIQSGAGAIRKEPTLSEAETVGKKFADAVECSNGPDPDVAACLREKESLEWSLILQLFHTHGSG